MELRFTSDAEQFAAAAEAFLAASLECNLLATVLAGARSARRPGVFAYGVSDGRVVLAALRTPPWGMLASPLPEGTAQALIERWLEFDPAPPSVSAETGSARALAAAWAQRTGGRSELQMAQALHVLQRVGDPPRPAPGRLRPATVADRELLVAWTFAFAREAGDVAHDVEATIDARLAARPPLIWEDGRPVSFLQAQPPVARVVRLGPVYTPPELRRRGYAGSAVAAASRRALATEADRCILFTDLANPTSNKIYAEVGYRRVGDWEQHRLRAA